MVGKGEWETVSGGWERVFPLTYVCTSRCPDIYFNGRENVLWKYIHTTFKHINFCILVSFSVKLNEITSSYTRWSKL